MNMDKKLKFKKLIILFEEKQMWITTALLTKTRWFGLRLRVRAGADLDTHVVRGPRCKGGT